MGVWIKVNNRVNIGITEIAYAIKKNDWSLIVQEKSLSSELELLEVFISHVIDVPSELDILAFLGHWHLFILIFVIVFIFIHYNF